MREREKYERKKIRERNNRGSERKRRRKMDGERTETEKGYFVFSISFTILWFSFWFSFLWFSFLWFSFLFVWLFIWFSFPFGSVFPSPKTIPP